MANNVVLASGALTVATVGDANNVQTQSVVDSFLSSAGAPINVATTTPVPIANDVDAELQTNILIELRVLTELIYALVNPETEPIEMLRAKFKDYSVTP